MKPQIDLLLDIDKKLSVKIKNFRNLDNVEIEGKKIV
jgi:hypothetical protein